MKNTLLPLLLLLITGFDQTHQATSRTPTPTPVEVATVSRSPLIAHRILTGSLQAVTTVHIFNEEEGRIAVSYTHLTLPTTIPSWGARGGAGR